MRCWGMDERLQPVPKEDLEFDIEQALREARRLWPRKHEWGDYNPYRPIARAVAEHLVLCRIQCFREPAPWHNCPPTPMDPDEQEPRR